jgi:hypothetical protein
MRLLVTASMKVSTGLLVLGLTAFLFIEWMQRAPVAPPSRPPSVPGDAVWLGLNKGEWFQCHLASGARNVVDCTIYNDVKGEKVSSGVYRWEGDRNQDLTAVPQLKAFDGQILSADGGRLIPIGKHVYYLPGSDGWTKDYSSGQ